MLEIIKMPTRMTVTVKIGKPYREWERKTKTEKMGTL